MNCLTLEHIADFLELKKDFKDLKKWESRGCQVSIWASVYSTSCLSKVGKFLSGLPSSTATLERFFSALKFQVEDRECLTIEHLIQEDFIRCNHRVARL